MTCRVGNFDALTYLSVTMRTHTNSFEKVLVGEKSRNRYFFRNAFCMRKDEVYHQIFYAFENICDILTLRDTINQVAFLAKNLYSFYLVDSVTEGHIRL